MGRLLWFNYPCLLLHNYILSDWVRVYCAIAQWFEGLHLCCWVENLNPYQLNWHGSSVHNHQWYNSNIIMNQKPLDPWKTRNGAMLCAYVACRFCSLYAWTNTYNLQALLSLGSPVTIVCACLFPYYHCVCVEHYRGMLFTCSGNNFSRLQEYLSTTQSHNE